MLNSMKSPMRWITGMLCALAVFALAGCGKQGSPLAPEVHPPKVLVLSDGRTQDSVRTILSDAGYAVTMGGRFWEYRGTDLTSYDAVVFLCGYDYNHPVADSVQQKLVNYVAAGGGLMGTEWIMYNLTHNSHMDRIANILPVTYSGNEQYVTEDYQAQAPLHAVAKGLPAVFTTTGPWSFSSMTASTDPAKQAMTIYRGSKSGDAVVIGVYGAGRTAHWNMAGEYKGSNIWSWNVRRLLVNVVEHVRRK